MTQLSVAAVQSNMGAPSHLVAVFTDISQLKETEARLARMAHYDTLTELPNRVLIRQRLSHAVNLAQRHNSLVGVLFMDFDHFKTINDGQDEAALVRNADAAMYESKRRGHNNFCCYTEALTADATLRLRMETLLRRAVEHREFTLHYQPMVRLSNRKIVAVEALVRLNASGLHTTGAGQADMAFTFSPDQFIPVMEDTGMIASPSDWVLAKACQQGREWLDVGLEFGRVAINLSPSAIRRGGVVERIMDILARTGLPA